MSWKHDFIRAVISSRTLKQDMEVSSILFGSLELMVDGATCSEQPEKKKK